MAGFNISTGDVKLLRDIAATAALVEDTPVPWLLLEQINSLLRGDQISLNKLDTVNRFHPLMQYCTADGERGVEVGYPGDESEWQFWADYWSNPCSIPDRTGDYESVTTISDFVKLADVRQFHEFNGGMSREIMVCLPPTSPGRHLRLLSWRSTGSDFGDRERFFLTLLRPHLERACLAGARRWSRAGELTPRQTTLLTLVRDGHTNLQIAHRLQLSEGTVRKHLNNIYARLQVSSRTAAVTQVFGMSSGGSAPMAVREGQAGERAKP
jgi:DNA-binding CsgD family transcriptional regulator